MTTGKRNALGETAAAALGAILFAVVVVQSSLNVANLVLYLRPGDILRAVAAPTLFDGSALVWLTVYIWGSHGPRQRLIALSMTALSVLAVVAANVYYLDLTSSSLVIGEFERAEATRWALRAIESAMAINLIAKFLHHLSAPSIQDTMREQDRTHEIMAKAADKADAYVEAISTEAAELLGFNARAATLRQLSDSTQVNLTHLALRAPGDSGSGTAETGVPEDVRARFEEAAATGAAYQNRKATLGFLDRVRLALAESLNPLAEDRPVRVVSAPVQMASTTRPMPAPAPAPVPANGSKPDHSGKA